MNLSAGKQALIWGTVALVFVLVLWGLGDVLMPFLLGMGIAYLLADAGHLLGDVGQVEVGAEGPDQSALRASCTRVRTAAPVAATGV